MLRERPALFCLLALLCKAPAALAQTSADNDHLAGTVNRLTSPTAFSLDNTAVELSPTATFATVAGHVSTRLEQPPVLFPGESLKLSGHARHNRPFLAEVVQIVVPTPVPVAGTALIDRILPPLTPSPAHPAPAYLLRADGYLLSLPVSVLPPTPVLTTNLILTYRGTLLPDGAVEVSSATLATPDLSKSEDKLRDRTEYDQEVMDAAAHSTPQSRLSRSFHGIDLGRLPVVEDVALQARVDRIGHSVLPPAALSLSPQNPLFLQFHFRVVDAPKGLHEAIALPSGTILLPAEAITRLSADNPTPAQLDNRIASTLAVGIAHIREEHLLRAIQLTKKLIAPSLAANAAGILIPGLGLATDLALGGVQQHATNLRTKQDDRIALALLHDAGYDLSQAGLSIALLNTSTPRPTEQLKLSSEALDIFASLGRLYGPTSLNSTLPATPPPSTPAPASPDTRPAS